MANAKGSGSRPNAKDGPNPLKPVKGGAAGLVQRMPGSVSIVSVPNPNELAALTDRAYANRKPAARGLSPARASTVVPATQGAPSPIRHVVYVIRENRTYDQVFGDLPKGNGDPSLVLFGRDLTPNAHAPSAETMVAPRGCCGVHSPPKAGQSVGFFAPRRIRPLMQIGDSAVCTSSTSNRRSASWSRYSALRR